MADAFDRLHAQEQKQGGDAFDRLHASESAGDEPSPFTKLGRAFWEWTGKPAMDIMGGASRDPELGKRAVETGTGIVKGLANEPWRVRQELQNMLGAKTFTGAAGSAIRAIPLYGPGISQSGTEFSQGKYAEGAGHTLAMLFPFLSGPAAEAATTPEALAAMAKSGRAVKGGIKGGVGSIKSAKVSAPAIAGGGFGTGVGYLFGGPRGAAKGSVIGSALGAAPGVWEGMVEGAKREMYGPPPVRPVMDAPPVTPQGQGLRGFPKPPVQKPFDPGPAAPPQYKTAPVERPFNPGPADKPVFKTAPVEKLFKPPDAPPPRFKTASAEPPAPAEGTGGVPSALTDLLERLRAQQPPPREPQVPYEPPAGTAPGAAPGNAPPERIRPEETNPAATPEGKEPLASTSVINWHKLPENQRGRFLNSEFHAAGKDIEGVGTGTRGRPSGNAVAKDLFGPDATWMGNSDTAISHARMNAINDFMTNNGRVPTKLDLDSGVFKDPGGGLPKPPK